MRPPGQIAQVQYTVAVALVGNFIINVTDMQASVASVASAAAVAARAALRRSRRRGVAPPPLSSLCWRFVGLPAAALPLHVRVLRACARACARGLAVYLYASVRVHARASV